MPAMLAHLDFPRRPAAAAQRAVRPSWTGAFFKSGGGALLHLSDSGFRDSFPVRYKLDHTPSPSDEEHYESQHSQGSREDQGAQIEDQLLASVEGFGTRHFNLMAHSKGGLDSRWWLTERKANPDYKSHYLILGQFITFNSVHVGSVIADYSYQSTKLSMYTLPDLVNKASDMKYPFLLLGGFLDKIAAGSPATKSLQTMDTRNFNSVNIPLMAAYKNPDGTAPSFIATSSDADVDGDGKISLPAEWGASGASAAVVLATLVPALAEVAASIISRFHPDVGPPYATPSECDKGVAWGGTFTDTAVVGTIGSRVAYQALRDISTATITSTFDLLIQAAEIGQPNDGKELNDFLVTQQSAECQYPGSPFSTKIFFPGKMHGDVSDFTVGEDLFGRGDVFIPRR
jgi:hypothetical protein